LCLDKVFQYYGRLELELEVEVELELGLGLNEYETTRQMTLSHTEVVK
jgi:hypothetical protein